MQRNSPEAARGGPVVLRPVVCAEVVAGRDHFEENSTGLRGATELRL